MVATRRQRDRLSENDTSEREKNKTNGGVGRFAQRAEDQGPIAPVTALGRAVVIEIGERKMIILFEISAVEHD